MIRYDEKEGRTVGGKEGSGFGIDIAVRRSVRPKQDSNAAGGVPINDAPEGDGPEGINALAPGNRLFRDAMVKSDIGSPAGVDLQFPPPQYVDTVPFNEREQNDPRLHGAAEVLRSADRNPALREYDSWQPRRMQMPRAAQDDGFLGMPQTTSADPMLGTEDSGKLILDKDVKRLNLYGPTRIGIPKKNS